MAFVSIFGFLSFINKQMVYAMLDIQGIGLFNSSDSRTNRVAYLFVANMSQFYYVECISQNKRFVLQLYADI